MKYVIVNFKSNKTLAEMKHWLQEFTHIGRGNTDTRIILCPPFPFLFACSDAVSLPHVSLGVQDVSAFPQGAYTGAVSARNLEGFSVKYAIVGHSERRSHFHESLQDVANKITQCVDANITPILCTTKSDIAALSDMLSTEEKKHLLVAFEPVEHIGTGKSDELEDILATKSLVATAFGDVPFIYGGSVNNETDPAILKNPQISGFLVGSGALDIHAFTQLLQKM